jgi:hypothetical protein
MHSIQQRKEKRFELAAHVAAQDLAGPDIKTDVLDEIFSIAAHLEPEILILDEVLCRRRC